MNNSIRTIVFATAAVLAAAGESAVADSPGPGEPTLAEVRTATEKYQDVKVALAEGYIRDPADMCETADMMGRPISAGAMGVHYFRPDLLGDHCAAQSARGWQWHIYGLPCAVDPDL